jgi:uncharacterized protein (TIGR03435 family)
MPRLPINLALIIVLASVICAQPARLTFDAASVKLAIVPDGITIVGDSITGDSEQTRRLKRTGGPGTSDPGRIHYPLISLRALLNLACEDSYAEIKAPDWLDTRTVSIDATMPRDTTREQFREMLRSLLADRLGLKYHVESRPGAAAYYLVVPENDPASMKSAPRRLNVEVMVIDHMDKTPTEN